VARITIFLSKVFWYGAPLIKQQKRKIEVRRGYIRSLKQLLHRIDSQKNITKFSKDESLCLCRNQRTMGLHGSFCFPNIVLGIQKGEHS